MSALIPFPPKFDDAIMNYLNITNPKQYKLQDIVKPQENVTYLICRCYHDLHCLLESSDTDSVTSDSESDFLLKIETIASHDQLEIDRILIKLIEEVLHGGYFVDLIVADNYLTVYEIGKSFTSLYIIHISSFIFHLDQTTIVVSHKQALRLGLMSLQKQVIE
jgi:hypothetical protein